MNIIVPGLYNSNPDHWQSIWQTQFPDDFYRVNQLDWSTPRCSDWVETLEQELQKFNLSDLILVGHSLGCIAIANWSERYKHIIKGALLVAPADAEDENFLDSVSGFAPISLRPMPFPTLVVSSLDDPYTNPDRAMFLARSWGSEFLGMYKAGHINEISGYGNWPFGLELIEKVKSLAE